MESEQQAVTSLDQAENPITSEPNTSKYVEYFKKLIHRRMLVRIEDGRFFFGTFYCVDKQGNIILQDAVEYRDTRRNAPSPKEHRVVGLILIPAACQKSCHVDCSIEEQMSILSLEQQK